MRFFFFTFFIASLFSVNAQNNIATIDSIGFELHSIDDKKGQIEYLVSKNRGADSPKPVIVFCQGSLPKPLIINTPQGVAGIFPFNHFAYDKRFRFLIISKPGIPIMPKSSLLDQRYNYLENGQFPTE